MLVKKKLEHIRESLKQYSNYLIGRCRQACIEMEGGRVETSCNQRKKKLQGKPLLTYSATALEAKNICYNFFFVFTRSYRLTFFLLILKLTNAIDEITWICDDLGRVIVNLSRDALVSCERQKS